MPNFRKALLIHFASSSGATAVQFLVSLILARLLTPAEIGVYSITIVLVNIAHVFREFGVASYLQREAELTPDKIRAAMGVLYGTTWTIALVIFLSSGLVAGYFGYPEVQPVMQVLSIGFLFIPFSSVMLALLVRDYAADKIAVTTAVGTIVYAVTCLGLASLGFGTMSLAWANLANILSTGLAYLPMRPAGLPWLPSWRNCGRVVKFGTGALLTNLLHSINNALPDLLLGKLGSAHQVGLVSRANSTVNIFLAVAGAAIGFGSQAFLAKAYHAQQPLAPILLRAVTLITGLGWPALAMIALLGHDIVYTLYGSAWLESVTAIPALACAAAIDLMFYYTAPAFIAIGRPYLAAFPVAVTCIGRVALAVAFFNGNVASFAWILMAATLCTLPAWLYLQATVLRCPVRALLRALWPSAQVTACCAVVGASLSWLLHAYGPAAPMARLAVLAAPLLLAWYGALRATSHPIVSEIDLILAAARRRLA
jgi:O-antigen/teichoic acid export membrane protein